MDRPPKFLISEVVFIALFTLTIDLIDEFGPDETWILGVLIRSTVFALLVFYYHRKGITRQSNSVLMFVVKRAWVMLIPFFLPETISFLVQAWQTNHPKVSAAIEQAPQLAMKAKKAGSALGKLVKA